MSKLTAAQANDRIAELEAMISAQQQSRSMGLLVKENKSGGIYIKAPSFIEYSVAKNKEYVAGINLGAATAKALFNNPELIDAIRDAINSMDTIK